MDKTAKYLRWLLEFLVCLYCSLLYMARWEAPGTRLVNMISRWIVVTDRFIVGRFHTSVFGATGTDPQLFMPALWILAFLTFAGIRLLGQIKLVGRFIPLVGVCLTVAGPLYFDLAAADEWHMGPRMWLMRFEIAAMIAILLRYGHRSSPAATFLCSGALVAHFWLWASIMISQPDRGFSLLSATYFVLLPFFTILTWRAYSSHLPSDRSDAVIRRA